MLSEETPKVEILSVLYVDMKTALSAFMGYGETLDHS